MVAEDFADRHGLGNLPDRHRGGGERRHHAGGREIVPMRSALYPGWVMHRRVRPRHHRFKYRVFAMLIDLDELPTLSAWLRMFRWNKPGLFSFYDRDHGDGRPLNTWLNSLLASAGIVANGPRR